MSRLDAIDARLASIERQLGIAPAPGCGGPG